MNPTGPANVQAPHSDKDKQAPHQEASAHNTKDNQEDVHASDTSKIKRQDSHEPPKVRADGTAGAQTGTLSQASSNL